MTRLQETRIVLTSEMSCSLASICDFIWWPGWSCWVAQARQRAVQHVPHHSANGIPWVWQFSLCTKKKNSFLLFPSSIKKNTNENHCEPFVSRSQIPELTLTNDPLSFQLCMASHFYAGYPYSYKLIDSNIIVAYLSLLVDLLLRGCTVVRYLEMREIVSQCEKRRVCRKSIGSLIAEFRSLPTVGAKKIPSLQQIVLYASQTEVVLAAQIFWALISIVILLLAVTAQRQLFKIRQYAWSQHLKDFRRF